MTDKILDKNLIFSGKKDDYDAWEVKHDAWLISKGCSEAVRFLRVAGDIAKDSEDLEDTSDATKVSKKKIREQSNTAMRLLMGALPDTVKGKQVFKMIKGCVNDDYPTGNYKQARKILEQRFRTKKQSNRTELLERYYSMKMVESQHPVDFILEVQDVVEELRKNHQVTIAADEVKLQILLRLPLSYEFQREALKKKLADANTKLEFMDIMDDLEEKYEEMF